MTEAQAAAVPAQGLFARAIGVVFSPRPTFEGVIAHPKVFGMMLLVAVLSAATIGGFMSTTVGQSAFLEQMRAGQARSDQEPSPQAAEGMRNFLPYMGVFYAVSIIAMTPIVAFAASGILFVVFNVVMGGTATFRQVLAVWVHSGTVSVLAGLFTTTLNYFRGTMTSATTLGVFMPMLDEKSFLFNVLSAIDILLIWWFITLSIGLSVLYRRKTGGIATGLLILYGLIALAVGYFKSR